MGSAAYHTASGIPIVHTVHSKNMGEGENLHSKNMGGNIHVC